MGTILIVYFKKIKKILYLVILFFSLILDSCSKRKSFSLPETYYFYDFNEWLVTLDSHKKAYKEKTNSTFFYKIISKGTVLKLLEESVIKKKEEEYVTWLKVMDQNKDVFYIKKYMIASYKFQSQAQQVSETMQ